MKRILSLSWFGVLCLPPAAVGAQDPPAAAPVASPAPGAAGAAASSSQPAFWRYVHPQAQALIGVDLEKIQGSALGKRIAAEFDQLGVKRKVSQEGFDFLPDVTRILLSTPGETHGKKRAVTEQAPFVMAMQGKFQVAQLRRKFAAKRAARSAYKGVEIWRPSREESDLCVGLVSPHLMLVGDRASMQLAIDYKQAEGAGHEMTALYGRAMELAPQYDFWFVTQASVSDLAGARLPQAQMLAGVDRLEGGLQFRDGLGMELSLHTASDEEASKMATALLGLAAMAGASARQQQPEMAQLLDKLSVGTHEGSVMLRLRYTQAEVDRSIDQLKASLPGAGSGSGAGGARSSRPVSVAASRPAPPPAGVVRIFNADGGTREVPLARD